MNKFIDTHAHYGHKKFKQPTANIIKDISRDVELIIQVGTNDKSNDLAVSLTKRFDNVYGMIGFFPVDVWELEQEFNPKANEYWDKFKQQLQLDKILGVGEIGLDYSWDKVGNFVDGEKARCLQKKWFMKQMELSMSYNLPVSIHSRDAEIDTLEVFDRYDSISGVIHCFSYGVSAAHKAIDKGLYLGIGGTSTYPSNKEIRDVIKMAPLDRLLLETDAPYLSPQPVRREINTSSNIKYVIQNIAEIKNIDCDEVVNATNNNVYQLFKKLK